MRGKPLPNAGKMSNIEGQNDTRERSRVTSMRNKYTVKLKTIAEEFKLQPLNLASNYEQALVTTADVNRPAMQLTGFYNYFDPKRIQIMGRVESTYLDSISIEERYRTFERFMQYDIAGLVICHGVPAFPECIEMARK